MSNPEALTHMLRIHDEGKAICGTYSREEAKKKVAFVLAFAAEHRTVSGAFLSTNVLGGVLIKSPMQAVAGRACHVPKPFSPRQLLAKIRQYLSEAPH